MSDSVDRVFVHALATVRRLPRTGSSRPPPSARLRLYGLYKQSMEGDVLAILARPTLPPTSPDLVPQSTTTTNVSITGNGNNNNNSNAVHRYASRDLRTREAQAEIEKWDAWHACAGMSRTEAKRRYISTLIETMKEYASGTAESRELVSELEFVWNQIKSQSGSSEEEEEDEGVGGAKRKKEKESPTRRLERSGLKPTMSYGSGGGAPSGGRSADGGRGVVKDKTDSNRMRVLSPVSKGSSDDIIEGVEVDADERIRRKRNGGGYEDDHEDSDEESEGSPIIRHGSNNNNHNNNNGTMVNNVQWREKIESHLHHLSTEIAALREQLSSNNLLSSGTYSTRGSGPMTVRRRIVHRISAWFRWLVWTAMRQIAIQSVLLLILLLWGRWRSDRRLEHWIRAKWKDLRGSLDPHALPQMDSNLRRKLPAMLR